MNSFRPYRPCSRSRNSSKIHRLFIRLLSIIFIRGAGAVDSSTLIPHYPTSFAERSFKEASFWTILRKMWIIWRRGQGLRSMIAGWCMPSEPTGTPCAPFAASKTTGRVSKRLWETQKYSIAIGVVVLSSLISCFLGSSCREHSCKHTASTCHAAT